MFRRHSHHHHGEHGHRFARPDRDFAGPHRMHRGGRGGMGRFFAHGDLRLVLLNLIAEKPRHGYELIKAIEEAAGGAYSPSPGVIYPTLTLLEELGYGLDLSSCAVTGARDDLAYVSPKSGRAVARGAAGDWVDRLLPLPACLMGQGPASADDIAAALRTTGHFLEHRLIPDLGHRPLPEARRRLAALISRGD